MTKVRRDSALASKDSSNMPATRQASEERLGRRYLTNLARGTCAVRLEAVFTLFRADEKRNFGRLQK
jgi:hypothetical protein